MAITAKNYWPLGSTVQKVDQIIENPSDPNYDYNNSYNHFGLYSVNPIDGTTALIYRSASHHTADYAGVIMIRTSKNGGKTWTHEVQVQLISLPSPPVNEQWDLRPGGGGYISNGNLLIFFRLVNTGSPHLNSSLYFTSSSDNGQSWNPPGLLNLISSNPNYLNLDCIETPFGHIVDAGKGVLYQTCYANYPNPNPTNGIVAIYKSIDNGLTFNSVIYVVNDNISNYLNNTYQNLWQVGEPSMINLGGGCFLILARDNEITAQPNALPLLFRQFLSIDNCNTWIEQTAPLASPPDLVCLEQTSPPTFYPVSCFEPSPPFLSFINFEGIGIVACYYLIRGNNNPQTSPPPGYLNYTILKVIFGLATDIVNNKTDVSNKIYHGWNLNTINVLSDFSGTSQNQTNNSGYQSFFHPLKQYKGIGVCFHETIHSNSQPPPLFAAYPEIFFSNDNLTQDPQHFDFIQILQQLGL